MPNILSPFHSPILAESFVEVALDRKVIVHYKDTSFYSSGNEVYNSFFYC